VGYSPEYIRCAIQAGENIRHGEIVTGTLKYFLERDLILLDRGQF